MKARVASMEDTKEARLAEVEQGSLFQTGMLKVFICFLLLVVGLSMVGMHSVHITREEITGPSPIQREEEGTACQGGKAGRALGHLLRALTPGTDSLLHLHSLSPCLPSHLSLSQSAADTTEMETTGRPGRAGVSTAGS